MKLIALLTALVATPLMAIARADGADDARRQEWTTQDEKAKSSNASFDKRLPPVLPGEEISDGKQTIKVWSTAGSPTERLEARQDSIPNEVSVIVDQRGSRNSRQRELHDSTTHER